MLFFSFIYSCIFLFLLINYPIYAIFSPFSRFKKKPLKHQTLTSCPFRWLFLLLHDGVHRISLPEVSDHAGNLTLVVKTDSVHDFVVSYRNKRLVFYDKDKRVLSAVSMDGLLPVFLYSEIKYDVQSLAFEDDLLMLTNAHAVYKQMGKGQVAIFTEFTMDCDIFRSSYGGFGNVRLFGPSSQPYPVPRKPRDLQVGTGCRRNQALQGDV